MGVLLDTELVEQWVVSWRRSLWNNECSRAGGPAGGGQAGRDFNRPLENALLQRGPLSNGRSLGDGVC